MKVVLILLLTSLAHAEVSTSMAATKILPFQARAFSCASALSVTMPDSFLGQNCRIPMSWDLGNCESVSFYWNSETAKNGQLLYSLIFAANDPTVMRLRTNQPKGIFESYCN